MPWGFNTAQTPIQPQTCYCVPMATPKATKSTTDRTDASLLARLVGIARTHGGMTGTSIRSFAREVGVSHTVIARIESGEVSKPHRDVLARIAAWSYREAAPLMYAAGHLSPQEFRNQLKPIFATESPIVDSLRQDEEYEDSSLSVAEIERRLRARTVAPEELDEVAEVVFSINLDQPGFEARHAASMLADDAPSEVALQELLDVWGYIEAPAREDLLAYARSLRMIADLEYQASEQAAELEAKSGGEGA